MFDYMGKKERCYCGTNGLGMWQEGRWGEVKTCIVTPLAPVVENTHNLFVCLGNNYLCPSNS